MVEYADGIEVNRSVCWSSCLPVAGSAEADPVTTGSDVRPQGAGRRRTLASGKADLLHQEAIVVL